MMTEKLIKVKKLLKRAAEFFDTFSKLLSANRQIKNLEAQNEFLIKALDAAHRGADMTDAVKYQYDALNAQANAKQAQERREEIDEIREELLYMEMIPVSGRNNMLARDKAVEDKRIRLLELETDDLSASGG